SSLEEGRLDGEALRAAKELLIGMERDWQVDAGLPGRPWFRNLYAASDETSGYAAWMLPGLRGAIERKSESELQEMQQAYGEVFLRLARRMEQIVSVPK
ncbi:MAG: hypothetical protein OER88_08595, partial [Planctomycetota bacterium]|nr:hypothetical protein [Planctomycetota bacterium]